MDTRKMVNSLYISVQGIYLIVDDGHVGIGYRKCDGCDGSHKVTKVLAHLELGITREAPQ